MLVYAETIFRYYQAMEVRGGHNARAFAQKLAASRHYVSLETKKCVVQFS